MTYVTVGKDSYLLEVPDSLKGRVPKDYELRSSKKVKKLSSEDVIKLIVCLLHPAFAVRLRPM